MRLENITKTFELKASKVVALDNVSLNLPNKGLVFIVGKSGCGKTTLLNIIGGLDKPTSGNVYFNNQNLASYRSTEYDNYRNNYVGFIFQDYNLINNLTVYDNLNLVLSLQNNNNHQKINDVLSCVGLDNYEKRYPHQLSGGEMQRIAIARALVKDPAFILADEPTGNLDSVNSKEIFDILKVISKEKLVIVVTHDRESALKYHDRIIELSDGSIIYDSNPLYISDDINVNNKDKKLNNKVSLKLSFANLKIRKLKTIMAILLLVISITLTMCAVIYGTYNTAKGNYLSITRNKENYVPFYEFKQNMYRKDNTYNNIDRKTGFTLIEQSRYPALYFNDSNICIITKQSELISFGIKFYEGSLELNSNGMYVSDTFLETIFSNNANDTYSIKYYINDELISEENYLFSDVINKNISKINDGNLVEEFRILGVYYMDNVIFDSSVKFMNLEYRNKLLKPHKMNEKGYQFENNDYSLNVYYNNNKFISEMSSHVLGIDLTQENNGVLNKIITKTGLINKDYRLKDDEMIINLETYNNLYNTDYLPLDIVDFHGNIVNELVHLNDILTLEVFDESYQQVAFAIDVKIIGVYLVNNNQQTFYLNYNNQIVINNLIENSISSIILFTNHDYDNLKKELKRFAANNLYPEFTGSFLFYKNEEAINTMTSQVYTISLILIVFTILLFLFLLSSNVRGDKKNIGILKALGDSNQGISMIYFHESLIISILAIIISLCLIPFCIDFLNKNFVGKYYPLFLYFDFDYLLILFAIIFCLIIATLFSFLSIKIIDKNNPIGIIKENV